MQKSSLILSKWWRSHNLYHSPDLQDFVAGLKPAMRWLSSQQISCSKPLTMMIIINPHLLSPQFYHLRNIMVCYTLSITNNTSNIHTQILMCLIYCSECWCRGSDLSGKEIHVIFIGDWARRRAQCWGGFVRWWITGRGEEEEAQHGTGEDTWEELWVGE